MKSFRTLAGAACLGVSVLLAAGCSSSSSPAPAAASTTTSGSSNSSTTSGVTLGTASTPLGTVLTAPNGMTLYRFDPDTKTTSACTGGCASVWPPVMGPASGGTGVTSSDLGTITRSDGTTQVTYQGHPLYTYTGDTGPGQTTGNGVQGTWHVMLAGSSGGSGSGTAPTTPPSTTSGGGGSGY